MLIYAFVATLLILYTLIAAFALQMTYYEQCKTNNQSIFYCVLSFIACVLWPITLLTVAVAVRRTAA